MEDGFAIHSNVLAAEDADALCVELGAATLARSRAGARHLLTIPAIAARRYRAGFYTSNMLLPRSSTMAFNCARHERRPEGLTVKKLLLAFTCLTLAAMAGAEIEKSGELCGNSMCLYWWPKLSPVKGWHHEDEISRKQGINALAPDGSTFADAQTVMYAAALSKAGGDAKSLDELIEADKAKFREHSPDSVAVEIAPMMTGDGQKLRTFTFFPKDSGNWEHVSFGEEGEYFLVFTVSSRSKSELEKALPAYSALIRGYKEKF